MGHPPGKRYQPEPRDGYGGSLPQPQDREYIDRISYQEACNTYDQDMHEDRVRDKDMQLGFVEGLMPLAGMAKEVMTGFMQAVTTLVGASTTLFSGDPIPPIKPNLEGLTPSEIKENWDKLVDHFGLGVVEAPDAVLEAGLHGYYGDPFLVDSDNDGYLDRVATEKIVEQEAVEIAIETTQELARRGVWGDFTSETGGEQTPAPAEINTEAEEYFTSETGGEQTPALGEINTEARSSEETSTSQSLGAGIQDSGTDSQSESMIREAEVGSEKTSQDAGTDIQTKKTQPDAGGDVTTSEETSSAESTSSSTLTDEEFQQFQKESSYDFQPSEQTSESRETYSQPSETANSESSQYSGVTGYSDSSSSSSYG